MSRLWCMLALTTLMGCQTAPQKPAAKEIFIKASESMKPFYQCAVLGGLNKNSEEIDKGFDEAVSIGEKNKLTPGQMMTVYQSVKKKQDLEIEDRAMVYALERAPNRTPSIMGNALPPVKPIDLDRVRAANELFGDQCLG